MLRGRPSGGPPARSRPRKLIPPRVGCSNPPISRSSVVFPQPEGPSSVTNSPAPKLSVVDWTAARDPNSLATALSTRKLSSRGSPVLAAGAGPGVPPARTPPLAGLMRGLSRVDIVICPQGCGISDRQHGVDRPGPAAAGAAFGAHHRKRRAHQQDRTYPDEHPDHVEGG